MAHKKRKTKTKTITGRKSFRQRRAAIIIASILALGMVLSVLLIYADFIIGGQRSSETDLIRQELEQEREKFEQQIENLREGMDIAGRPNPGMLRDIAACYRELVGIQQYLLFLGDESDLLDGYRDELVQVYRDLINLEPYNVNLHKEFLNIFYSLVDDAGSALEIALILRDLLRENTETSDYLGMIYIMNHYDQNEFVEEELAWLRDHLEAMVLSGEIDNHDRYVFGLLLNHFLEEPDLAREQLILILDTEEEESVLYNQAKNYLEFMDADDEDE